MWARPALLTHAVLVPRASQHISVGRCRHIAILHSIALPPYELLSQVEFDADRVAEEEWCVPADCKRFAKKVYEEGFCYGNPCETCIRLFPDEKPRCSVGGGGTGTGMCGVQSAQLSELPPLSPGPETASSAASATSSEPRSPDRSSLSAAHASATDVQPELRRGQRLAARESVAAAAAAAARSIDDELDEGCGEEGMRRGVRGACRPATRDRRRGGGGRHSSTRTVTHAEESELLMESALLVHRVAAEDGLLRSPREIDLCKSREEELGASLLSWRRAPGCRPGASS